MDYSPQDSSVHGIFQAILEWVAICFLRGSSQSRNWTRVSCVSCIGRWILYHWVTRETLLVVVFVTQSCPTLWDPTDCSPPGSSAHGILQERILEWVAMPFSRGSSQPRGWTWDSSIAGIFFTIWSIGKSSSSTKHWFSFFYYANCLSFYNTNILLIKYLWKKFSHIEVWGSHSDLYLIWLEFYANYNSLSYGLETGTVCLL